MSSSAYQTEYENQIDGTVGVGALFMKKFGAFLYLYKSEPGSVTSYKPVYQLSNNGTTLFDCP